MQPSVRTVTHALDVLGVVKANNGVVQNEWLGAFHRAQVDIQSVVSTPARSLQPSQQANHGMVQYEWLGAVPGAQFSIQLGAVLRAHFTSTKQGNVTLTWDHGAGHVASTSAPPCAECVASTPAQIVQP